MARLVRFGGFELDLETADLRNNGRIVRLPEQQFQVLRLLLERNGDPVAREEIRRQLWPNDTVVEFDRSINAAIMKLRITLGDIANKPAFIETLARRGYRFLVPAEFDRPVQLKSPEAPARHGSLVGTKVLHYRILDVLGGGGMGLVYRGEDLHLNRPVALKFLPEEVTEDTRAFGLLEREARTASSLNHSNICTIYQVEEHNGQPFIVMELLEGETLRALIVRHASSGQYKPPGLPLEQVLDVAVQIAEGLQAAHQKGVSHRDIKPANIFLTSNGQVKILDFGLAKVNTADTERTETARPKGISPETSNQVPSSPHDVTLSRFGVAMGTVGYMSPEQIQGERLDCRTDLFSFGLILFEMVTGQRAFVGETPVEVQTAILHTTPVPVRQLNPSAPVELERVISTCLEKDRNLRYQHASEVRDDLFRLKQEADSWRISSAGIVSSSAFRKSKFWVAVAVLILAVGGVALGISRYLRPTRQPFQKIKMEIAQPAVTGNQSLAAISRDGRFMALATGSKAVGYAGEHDKESLWILQTAGSAVQIVPPDEVHYSGLAFSTNGNFLYFVSHPKRLGSFWSGTICKIPVLGGQVQRLIDNVGSTLTLSPDGKQFAFVRGALDNPGNSELIVANEDGGAEKTIARDSLGRTIISPTWSPDGKTIAFAKMDHERSWRLIEVSVNGGPERFVSNQRWADVSDVVWLSNRRGLIVAGQDKRGEPVQLNYVSSVTGDISRITNDLNDYYGLSITADSRVMAAAQDDFTSDIWVGTLAAPGKVFPISSGGRAMQPVWSPDGGVVYLAVEGGRTNLWRMQSDGSNPRPLSTMDLGQTMWPRISPDGRSIVFSSTKSGSWHLWRADIHGSNPQQLTHGAHETFSDTSISPDGKWVLFVDPENDNVEGIWKVSVDGGDPILVKKGNVADPVVSPDGKQIAYLYWDEKLKPSRGVAIMPFEAGPPTRLLDIPAGGLAWTPDGRSLLYAKKENEVFNLWIQPLAGGPSRQVTHFDIGSINGYDLSRDGKRLVMDRTTASSRVVLIQDLR